MGAETIFRNSFSVLASHCRRNPKNEAKNDKPVHILRRERLRGIHNIDAFFQEESQGVSLLQFVDSYFSQTYLCIIHIVRR